MMEREGLNGGRVRLSLFFNYFVSLVETLITAHQSRIRFSGFKESPTPRTQISMDDAPTDFISWRLKKHAVSPPGKVNSHILYELCPAPHQPQSAGARDSQPDHA